MRQDERDPGTESHAPSAHGADGPTGAVPPAPAQPARAPLGAGELPSEQLWRAAMHAALGAAHTAADIRRSLGAARVTPPAA